MRRTWTLLLAFAVATPALATAPEPPSPASARTSAWTGTWTIDRAASDSLEAVLRAQGVSKAKRLVADKVELTQKLVDHGDRLDVEMIGPRPRSGTLTFDGKERSKTTDQGEMHYRAKREASGAVVVISRPAAGGGLIIVVQRTLDADGQTLRQTVTVKGGADGPVSATLVFRRAP